MGWGDEKIIRDRHIRWSFGHREAMWVGARENRRWLAAIRFVIQRPKS